MVKDFQEVPRLVDRDHPAMVKTDVCIFNKNICYLSSELSGITRKCWLELISLVSHICQIVFCWFIVLLSERTVMLIFKLIVLFSKHIATGKIRLSLAHNSLNR